MNHLSLNTMKCCGIRELAGLSYYQGNRSIYDKRILNTQEAFRDFLQLTWLRQAHDPRRLTRMIPNHDKGFRYILFSQACKENSYGTQFAAFLEKNKLGPIMETTFNINPNSRNQLKIWIWTVDHDAVTRWVEQDAKAQKKVAQHGQTEEKAQTT